MNNAPNLQPSPREREIQESCLRSMRRFQEAANRERLRPREREVLWERLRFLLHYLVACKGRTLDDVTQEDLREWLAPSAGLYEHDLRLKLFAMLSGEYSVLKAGRASSGATIRKAKEFLFYGSHHREISRRTRDFFNAIQQSDIDAH